MVARWVAHCWSDLRLRERNIGDPKNPYHFKRFNFFVLNLLREHLEDPRVLPITIDANLPAIASWMVHAGTWIYEYADHQAGKVHVDWEVRLEEENMHEIAEIEEPPPQ